MVQHYTRRSDLAHGDFRGVSEQDLRKVVDAVTEIMKVVTHQRGDYSTLSDFQAHVKEVRSQANFIK